MKKRKRPTIDPQVPDVGRAPTIHSDGTVSFFSLYGYGWRRLHASRIHAREVDCFSWDFQEEIERIVAGEKPRPTDRKRARNIETARRFVLPMVSL